MRHLVSLSRLSATAQPAALPAEHDGSLHPANPVAAGSVQPVALPAEDDARWRAVVERDPAARDLFVYAVASTGIYCRPTCPSRRPRAANVRFFDSAAEALRAGYRACLRCRPGPHAAGDPDLTARVAAHIRAADTPPTLAVLAAAAGVSRFHLQRTFKRDTGLTPKQFADALRTGRWQAALGAAGRVTDANYDAGFGSASRAWTVARRELGMTPGEFARHGAGQRIEIALARCDLGQVIVARSAAGICAIHLGDDSEALVGEVRQRFPQAELHRDDAGFGTLLAAVVDSIAEPARAAALPLDLRGTIFQRRVWQALRDIPPGSTVTYGELARRLGSPGAARAVARACAENPAAVAIPCHRVIAADGSLAGYRWGIERKRALLGREASMHARPSAPEPGVTEGRNDASEPGP